MIKLTSQQLSNILNAQLFGEADIEVNAVNTDTRKTVQSAVFFALKGEHFDAHHYLDAAVEQGALVLVVEQINEKLAQQCSQPIAQLVVPDTKLALGQLAKWLKAKLQPITVAITGSSGKTTVKEMTASILQAQASIDNPHSSVEQVLFTQGNFNNDIGVPLTLLRLTEQHRFAVLELGANHLGEIAYTTDLVQPNVALVNNVAAAHLEGFGSIEGVAQAKGEIFRGLQVNGIAVMHKDHNHLAIWQNEIGERKVCTFSDSNHSADFYAVNVQCNGSGSQFELRTPQGSVSINLSYLGKHNVNNALAATALAMNVGASLTAVKQGLEKGSQVKGRLFPVLVNKNVLLLDDTYNANVDSLSAAIKVLQGYVGYRILVVGDMAELGNNSANCHQQVADVAKQANLDMVLSFGEESAVISTACGGKHFQDKSALCQYVQQVIEQTQAHQNIVLLAKGSRRMKMEEVIQYLKESLC